MTKKIISNVQDYLTVLSEDRCYQIVNVELLLRRHPPEAVIDPDICFIAFNKLRKLLFVIGSKLLKKSNYSLRGVPSQ